MPTAEHEFDRLDLMLRLSRATAFIEALGPAKSKAGQTEGPGSREIAQIVTAALQLANDDPDYSADSDYVQHARDLSNAIELFKSAINDGDEEQRKSAIRAVRHACDECHQRFDP